MGNRLVALEELGPAEPTLAAVPSLLYPDCCLLSAPGSAEVSGFPLLCLRTAYHACLAIALPLVKPDVRIYPHPAFVNGPRCRVSR